MKENNNLNILNSFNILKINIIFIIFTINILTDKETLINFFILSLFSIILSF